MDQAQTGRFIAACRREQGLTQVQPAERPLLTNRAVSKWETGKGLPGAAVMMALCRQLDITVTELLRRDRGAALPPVRAGHAPEDGHGGRGLRNGLLRLVLQVPGGTEQISVHLRGAAPRAKPRVWALPPAKRGLLSKTRRFFVKNDG